MKIGYLRYKNNTRSNNTASFEVGFDDNTTCMQVHTPPLSVPQIGDGVTRQLKQLHLTRAEQNYVPPQEPVTYLP